MNKKHDPLIQSLNSKDIDIFADAVDSLIKKYDKQFLEKLFKEKMAELRIERKKMIKEKDTIEPKNVTGQVDYISIWRGPVKGSRKTTNPKITLMEEKIKNNFLKIQILEVKLENIIKKDNKKCGKK